MMKNVLKQIFSFILPVTVLVLVPLWIEKDFTIRVGINLIFGLILILAGLNVMVVTISSFIRIGKGTLAPWSPTQKLVIRGLYQYVRNPMILGVLTILLGESLCFWSKSILNGQGLFLSSILFILLFMKSQILKKDSGRNTGNIKDMFQDGSHG